MFEGKVTSRNLDMVEKHQTGNAGHVERGAERWVEGNI
jgi:hypothetical protein